jgi:hypothetical protein
MTIFSRKYRRLMLFMLPVLITLCGLFIVSYGNRAPENGHGLNTKGKQFLKDLASSSDLVVWGRVGSVRYGTEENTIFTYVSVEPTEVISGQVTEPLIVRQIGGTVGNRTGFVAGGLLPNWSEGEEVLLFLVRLEETSYYISGSSGKFTAAKLADGLDVFQINPNIRNSDLPREAIPDAAYPKSDVLEYVRGLRR